jgi:hypothetical protein
MKNLLAVCALSNVGLHMESTITLWKQPLLKWDATPLQKSFMVCRFTSALIWPRLDMALIAFVSAFANQQESQHKAKGIKYLTINGKVLFEFQLAARKPKSAGKLYCKV